MHAPAKMLLRHRLVVAHVFAAVDHLENSGRHVEQGMAVRVPRFKEQHPRITLRHESGGCDTSRGAASNHNEIVSVAHRPLASKLSRLSHLKSSNAATMARPVHSPIHIPAPRK